MAVLFPTARVAKNAYTMMSSRLPNDSSSTCCIKNPRPRTLPLPRNCGAIANESSSSEKSRIFADARSA